MIYVYGRFNKFHIIGRKTPPELPDMLSLSQIISPIYYYSLTSRRRSDLEESNFGKGVKEVSQKLRKEFVAEFAETSPKWASNP